ncbi:DUF362 domain-containing protein, partial [candidate division KSB1 bacterium]|nr:DUF362 domain-containing protein [candidate division KSB1 bacterium]
MHRHRRNNEQSNPLPAKKKSRKYLLPIIGFISLVWFLLRVMPKPSRAAYPCQRVAFPLASGFVLWVAGLSSSILMGKKLKKHIASRRFAQAVTALLLLVALLGFSFLQTPSLPALARDDPFVPIDAPNSPMGAAKGLFPGRVVWAHDPDATSWDGAGYWSDDAYTNQAIVDDMVSQSLRDLTGTPSDAAAWEALFRHFNSTHGNGDVSYQSGEKIAIKLNLNACNTHGSNRNNYYSSPQGAFAMLQQLVENAGVKAENITFFDATRFIPREIFDKCKAAYPTVLFADWEGGDGRIKVQRNLTAQIIFSQPLTLEPDGGNPAYVPTCVSEAKYLINMGQLKGHNLAGITL